MLAVVAVTAANTVSPSQIDDQETPRSADDIKPSWCGANVTTVINGTTGGSASELILGGSGSELMFGNGGDDCIHGGAGDDTIDGGLLDDDWCKGGPGLDTFLNCEHTIQD